MNEINIPEIDVEDVDWNAVAKNPGTGVTTDDFSKFYFLAVLDEDRCLILGEARYYNPQEFNAWVQCCWAGVNHFVKGGSIHEYNEAQRSYRSIASRKSA
ncbi:MAG: hypothetical protein ACXVCY_04345 [Pseudobdellovibrionaceae bacterium]